MRDAFRGQDGFPVGGLEVVQGRPRVVESVLEGRGATLEDEEVAVGEPDVVGVEAVEVLAEVVAVPRSEADFWRGLAAARGAEDVLDQTVGGVGVFHVEDGVVGGFGDAGGEEGVVGVVLCGGRAI